MIFMIYVIYVIYVIYIINLYVYIYIYTYVYNACGKRSGALFFHQPLGKPSELLDIPRSWHDDWVYSHLFCIILHHSTIFYHDFLWRKSPDPILCTKPPALHAHRLVLWPYLADATHLRHLSRFFVAAL